MVDVLSSTELLRAPTKDEISASEFSQVQRMDVDCCIQSERFSTNKTAMAAQYSDLYFVRLSKLKGEVLKESGKLWPDAGACDRILEAKTGVRSVLVGTIYKDMRLKPNILKKYSGEEHDTFTTQGLDGDKFVSDSDYAVIEDESGRLTLVMEGDQIPKSSDLTTGVVMGVVGALSEEGSFVVEAVCYPGLPPQETSVSEVPDGAHILLVSGLGLGGDEGAALSADLLVDYVTGSLGGGTDHGEAAKIIRVIIAGDSCSKPAPAEVQKAGEPPVAQLAAIRGAHPVRELDMLLTRLCASVPVDLMPGPNDPSGVFMPQQPFHRCLLPSANTYSTFRSVTNPYAFRCGVDAASGPTEAGSSIVGSSGQNVEDVLRYSTLGSPLEVMEHMLKWRHMAPTCPDTLACFPTADTDPFILESCPLVFFAGNQESFASKLVQGEGGARCLAVALPAFSKGGSAALVNLKTLECSEINFDVAAITSSQ